MTTQSTEYGHSDQHQILPYMCGYVNGGSIRYHIIILILRNANFHHKIIFWNILPDSSGNNICQG